MAQNFNDLLLEIRRQFREAGIASADLDAREILCAATGKTRAELVRDYGIYAAEETLESVRRLARRRLKGEPLAYLTGSWEFCGMELLITPDVLIPRDDTMVLAQAAIDAAKNAGPGARVLDLCTGSGCVGLAVARQAPECRSVLLADVSDPGLTVPRSNIRRVQPACSVSCSRVDVLKPPAGALGTFNVIACNPPYIPTGDLAGLDVSVRDYEPWLALDGGEDGLDFYRALSQLWKKALKPGGWLLTECGWDQARAVSALLEENGFEQIQVLKDTGGNDRVVAGTWSNIARR